MKARILVTLKSAVLDPQGKAIEGALRLLEISGIESVRQGKVFDIEVNEPTEESARQVLDRACQQLLANQVIENYSIAFDKI